jgi:hypothetical protein
LPTLTLDNTRTNTGKDEAEGRDAIRDTHLLLQTEIQKFRALNCSYALPARPSGKDILVAVGPKKVLFYPMPPDLPKSMLFVRSAGFASLSFW